MGSSNIQGYETGFQQLVLQAYRDNNKPINNYVLKKLVVTICVSLLLRTKLRSSSS